MVKKINIETATQEELAEAVHSDTELLGELFELISGDNRRLRQKCAGVVAAVSEQEPELLVPYAHDLIDALYRPEAKTRWEALEALANIVGIDARATDKAVTPAESSLYDEESGPARLAAFKFLAAYGETTANRAERVWPLLDEAIQCYHGDSEFQDMLVSLMYFAQGKAPREVKAKLIERMRFDAENGKGQLARRAKQIIDYSKGA